ncbi:MAG: sigma-70 family RNA polymerase sigma factor [Planctomycetota bacterium]
MAPSDLERLARDHAPFLRRLAFALVGDEAAADDLVQETWLAAARSREGELRSPRGWLSRTARNIAWSEHRRRARRAEATLEAEPAAGRDTADVAASLEAERLLVASLGALEEPFRTAVYLRYREDLAPAEIAERTDVALNTVRSRLRRGLARLRERLEEDLGGAERTRAALLPLAFGARPDAPEGPLGSFLALPKLAVALALVVLGIGAYALYVPSESSGASDEPAIARASSVTVAGPASVDPASSATSREGAVLEGDTTARSAPSAASTLLVRVVDESGVAAPDVGVHLSGDIVSTRYFTPREGRTDVNGEARFDGLPGGTYFVQSPGSERAKRAEVDGSVDAEITLELRRPLRVTGVVRDEDGRAVAGASLHAWSRVNLAAALHLGRADAAGRFDVRVHGGADLFATSEGHAPMPPVRASRLEEVAPGELRADLRVRRVNGVLAGRVVDGAGAPVPDALLDVSADANPEPYGRHDVRTSVRTDSYGRFSLEQGFAVGDEARLEIFATGFAPVYRRVEIEDAGSGTGIEIEMTTGRRLMGRALLEDGTPAVDATARAVLGARGFMGDMFVGVWRPRLRTDADGRFVLEDAPSGPFTVVVEHAPEGRAQRASHPVLEDAPLEGEVAIELSSRPSVRGRVVDENGAPLAGLRVQAKNEGRGIGRTHRYGAWTDDDGRFELTSLVAVPEAGDGPTWGIEVFDISERGFFELATVAGVLPDVEDLTVVVEGAHAAPDCWVEGVVLAPDGGPPPAHAEVLLQLDTNILHPATIDPDSGAFRAGPFRPANADLFTTVTDDLHLRRSGIELVAGEVVDVGTIRLGGGGQLALRPVLDDDLDAPAEALDGLYRDQDLQAFGPGGGWVDLDWSNGRWRTRQPIQPGRWTVRHKDGERLALDTVEVVVEDGETAESDVPARLGYPVPIEPRFEFGADWASLLVVSQELGGSEWTRTSRSYSAADLERIGLRIVVPCGTRSRLTVRTDTGLEGSVELDAPGFMEPIDPVPIELR